MCFHHRVVTVVKPLILQSQYCMVEIFFRQTQIETMQQYT
jgi:hypothetical protein